MAPETLLTTGTVWLKKYYYDTYGIVSGNANFAYTAKSGYGTRHEYGVEGTDISTRNMLCAEEEKVLGLDTEKVLTTVWYYDDKGRVVQEIRTNIMGGYDKTYTAYTFTGLPSETLQEHTVPGKDSVTERYRFVYDNAERIKQKYYRLNSDAEILLQECTYNDFGQLQQESVNGGYVKHAYTYNVRGWLSGQTSGYGGSTDNAFDLMLYTSNPKSGGSVSYNGNISAIEWTSKSDNVTRGYSFSYDGLGRMTSGVYGEGASLGTNTDRYNETLTYDRNGNIKTLLRSGRLDNGSFGPIDNLSMTLSGNRILSVAEGCANQSSNDLMEYKNTGSGGSRAYDANGRLTSDGNRGITGIEYNVLNLPTKITFTNGSAIRYGYSYSGEKLWTKYSFSSEPLFEPLSSPATGLSSTGNESERYYSGNKIYNDGTLDMILIDGGYIKKENTGYAYHHYIKDHLGSNRMVVKVNSGIQQVQHYYPFGLSFAEATNRSYQPYKYNGKELVSDEGLNWYDYLARVYDPALLIFTTMDPMAEKYYSISPYAYCMNNPVRYIDLDGMSTHTDSLGHVVAVYNNDDMGVYKHDISSSTYDGSLLSADGGTMMGETYFWNEFINPESRDIFGTIQFGKSFDPIIAEKTKLAEGMNLKEIAANSGGGGVFDIKKDYQDVGGLLGGKYVSSRSAGNYLAGLNASKGTLMGAEISFETFQKLAGALHIEEANGGRLSTAQKVDIVLFGTYSGVDKSRFVSPLWGESPYQYRMSKMGWNYGKKK